jgi:hypothetical protein
MQAGAIPAAGTSLWIANAAAAVPVLKTDGLRGNRLLKEAGLTLKIQPTMPTAKPFHESLRNQLKFPDWEFFVRR